MDQFTLSIIRRFTSLEIPSRLIHVSAGWRSLLPFFDTIISLTIEKSKSSKTLFHAIGLISDERILRRVTTQFYQQDHNQSTDIYKRIPINFGIIPLQIDWQSCLEGACKSGHIEFINKVLSLGADEGYQFNFHRAIAASASGLHTSMDLMHELITQFANLTDGTVSKGILWKCAIMGACKIGNPELADKIRETCYHEAGVLYSLVSFIPNCRDQQMFRFILSHTSKQQIRSNLRGCLISLFRIKSRELIVQFIQQYVSWDFARPLSGISGDIDIIDWALSTGSMSAQDWQTLFDMTCNSRACLAINHVMQSIPTGMKCNLYSGFQAACATGDIKLAQVFMEHIQGEDFCKGFRQVCKTGNMLLVQFLLNRVPKHHSIWDHEDVLPLMTIAAKYNHIDIVLLIASILRVKPDRVKSLAKWMDKYNISEITFDF